ncbi:MAG TPA: GtrA family protein [Candidatus Saccharimonadales bacterium]|nr:GtrA family protein [Candidatus Saccharimonadales bacterium]
MKNLIKKHAEKFRFVLVGIAATVIDWGILFTLVAFGSPTLPSNYVSTSFAMVFSFFTNKSFTFKASKMSRKHVVYFIIITVFGLWVIQPIIIAGVDKVLGAWFTDSQLIKWVGTWIKTKDIVLLIEKGLATAASLIWNYLMYRKYVFVKES